MCVMLICAIVFAGSATFALSNFAPTLMLAKMAPSGMEAFPAWLALALPFALPLYCSHTFARVLIRRSVLSARVFLVLMLLINTFAALFGWSELFAEPLWLGIWIVCWMLPMVWLFISLGPKRGVADRALMGRG